MPLVRLVREGQEKEKKDKLLSLGHAALRFLWDTQVDSLLGSEADHVRDVPVKGIHRPLRTTNAGAMRSGE